MHKSYIQISREKIFQDQFYLSHHAQIERGEEKIKIDDIVNCILNGEVLESYPNDQRGESCLIAGKCLDDRWLHVLCGNFYKDNILIITVYIPQPPKWIDPFTRRK